MTRRIRRTVATLTRKPGLVSSPCTLRYPRAGFSRASRSARPPISRLIAGRPGRLGEVHERGQAAVPGQQRPRHRVIPQAPGSAAAGGTCAGRAEEFRAGPSSPLACLPAARPVTGMVSRGAGHVPQRDQRRSCLEAGNTLPSSPGYSLAGTDGHRAPSTTAHHPPARRKRQVNPIWARPLPSMRLWRVRMGHEQAADSAPSW
jgi:hypothetical protein